MGACRRAAVGQGHRSSGSRRAECERLESGQEAGLEDADSVARLVPARSDVTISVCPRTQPGDFPDSRRPCAGRLCRRDAVAPATARDSLGGGRVPEAISSSTARSSARRRDSRNRSASTSRAPPRRVRRALRQVRPRSSSSRRSRSRLRREDGVRRLDGKEAALLIASRADARRRSSRSCWRSGAHPSLEPLEWSERAVPVGHTKGRRWWARWRRLRRLSPPRL